MTDPTDPGTLPAPAAMWAAVTGRDAAFDGRFLYGVVTTGVFCRPSCPARKPLRANVRFFKNAAEAAAKGFRPCRKCRPDLPEHDPAHQAVEQAKSVIARAFDDPEALAAGLHGLGLTQARLAKVFSNIEGVTLARSVDALRLAKARRLLEETGMPVARVALECGYASLSSFYRRFRQDTGAAPGRFRKLRGI